MLKCVIIIKTFIGKETILTQEYKFPLDAFKLFDVCRCNLISSNRRLIKIQSKVIYNNNNQRYKKNKYVIVRVWCHNYRD
jgi:hypothetical protein